MGTDATQRGYSDRLYMAMTDQERIAGQTYKAKDGTVGKCFFRKIIK